MKKVVIKFRQIQSSLKNLVDRTKFYVLGFFILGLIADIFFNPKISDSVVILLVIAWLISIKNFKIKPVQSLVLAIISYSISFIFQFFNKELIVEKGASWFFVFLTISLAQRLIGKFFKNEKKV